MLILLVLRAALARHARSKSPYPRPLDFGTITTAVDRIRICWAYILLLLFHHCHNIIEDNRTSIIKSGGGGNKQRVNARDVVLGTVCTTPGLLRLAGADVRRRLFRADLWRTRRERINPTTTSKFEDCSFLLSGTTEEYNHINPVSSGCSKCYPHMFSGRRYRLF